MDASGTSYLVVYLFLGLGIAALLGLIPANIAKSKGRSFGLWWFYGWMLFIVALIHAASLPYDQTGPDRPSEAAPEQRRKCPQCAEYVKREAKVCRFCGYDLTPILEAEAAAAERDRQAEQARRIAEAQASRAAEEARQAEWERTAPQRRRIVVVVSVVAVVAVVVGGMAVASATRQRAAEAQRRAFEYEQHQLEWDKLAEPLHGLWKRRGEGGGSINFSLNRDDSHRWVLFVRPPGVPSSVAWSLGNYEVQSPGSLTIVDNRGAESTLTFTISNKKVLTIKKASPSDGASNPFVESVCAEWLRQ